jgi:NAD(P)-dependent dehydrogenase (short-subunit alcohol dehydrogenase family)
VRGATRVVNILQHRSHGVSYPVQRRLLREQGYAAGGRSTAAATADGLKGLLAHCQSKAANVLFTVALRERTLKGYGIDSFAVDPGWETSLSDVMRLS